MAYGDRAGRDGHPRLRRERVVPPPPVEETVAEGRSDCRAEPARQRTGRARDDAQAGPDAKMGARCRREPRNACPSPRHATATPPRRTRRRAAHRAATGAPIRTPAALPVGVSGRVLAALAALVAAKVANVGVPLVLKEIVDAPRPRVARCWPCRSRCWSPTALLRLSTTLFTELREFLFAKVTQRAVRAIALEVFRHLHALVPALPPGAPDRRPDRATSSAARAASRRLISFMLFSILPTLVEIAPGVGDPDRHVRLDASSRSRSSALGALHRLHGARSPSGAPTSAGR